LFLKIENLENLLKFMVLVSLYTQGPKEAPEAPKGVLYKPLGILEKPP
jgi:hypothetical protein